MPTTFYIRIQKRRPKLAIFYFYCSSLENPYKSGLTDITSFLFLHIVEDICLIIFCSTYEKNNLSITFESTVCINGLTIASINAEV